MGDRLAGKVAFVSGGTRGIGRSIAEYFGSEGAKVAVASRTVEKGEKVVARIVEAGGDAKFFPLDITDETSVKTAIESAAEHFGGLSTLINNAAPTDLVASSYKTLDQYSTEEWERIMLGTLTGNVFWATKYAWPFLSAAEGASIVNISSSQSIQGFTGFGAYGAAKAGVNSLTRTYAVEGAPVGIRSNCILVGRVVSGSGDTGRATGPGHLTGLGRPTDIAYVASWLASDEARFVTGSMVTADGGFTINGDAIGNAG